MNGRRRAWPGLIIAGAVAIGGLAAATFLSRQSADAGGEFAALGRGLDNVSLTNASGAEVRWGELKGAPRAVFFGFTHCPVTCPVTVWELNDAIARIGPAADGIAIEFITIDPARDTPERLQTYLSSFGARVTGYTGEEAEIARLAAGFDVAFERVDLENGAYTMDHTATVFLVDASGRVVDVIAHGSPPEIIAARLRALIAAN